ncbi:hypothetical protein Tco_1217589 [Tanacetum coccineum]
MHTVRGDGVAGIKRRCRDLYGDGVRNLATASGRGRLKEDLESSMWRRRQDFKATPSRRWGYGNSSLYGLGVGVSLIGFDVGGLGVGVDSSFSSSLSKLIGFRESFGLVGGS